MAGKPATKHPKPKQPGWKSPVSVTMAEITTSQLAVLSDLLVTPGRSATIAFVVNEAFANRGLTLPAKKSGKKS